MTRRKDTQRRKKSRSKPRIELPRVSEQDAETLRLCRSAAENLDIPQLRQLACTRGFVSREMRQLCWPLLLGLGPGGSQLVLPPPEGAEETSTQPEDMQPQPSEGVARPCSREQYEQWHTLKHRDSHVVMVDVERSLWTFTPGMSDGHREVLREQLQRLLNAVVGQYAGTAPEGRVYYYQGLHDIASVLLLEQGGEARAFPLLSRMVAVHLRDCSRESLEPVLELLQLLWPLLCHVDRELGQALQALDMPPYFALSWYITWFAHDVKDLKTAARLFDVFLSSHPLMPLYLGATAMRCLRQPLLACREMHEAHTLLAHLDLTGEAMPPLEQLLGQAVKLIERVPPKSLLRTLGRDAAPMRLSVSAWAELDPRGVWTVPQAPGLMPAWSGGNGLQQLLSSLPHWLLRRGLAAAAADANKRSRHSRPLVALSLGGMLSVYVVAVVLGYTVMRGPAGP